MTHKLLFSVETGEWDIPEVMVYSNSSSWQRDHDQEDPEHHWCGMLTDFTVVVSGKTKKLQQKGKLSLNLTLFHSGVWPVYF